MQSVYLDVIQITSECIRCKGLTIWLPLIAAIYYVWSSWHIDADDAALVKLYRLPERREVCFPQVENTDKTQPNVCKQLQLGTLSEGKFVPAKDEVPHKRIAVVYTWKVMDKVSFPNPEVEREVRDSFMVNAKPEDGSEKCQNPSGDALTKWNSEDCRAYILRCVWNPLCVNRAKLVEAFDLQEVIGYIGALTNHDKNEALGELNKFVNTSSLILNDRPQLDAMQIVKKAQTDMVIFHRDASGSELCYSMMTTVITFWGQNVMHYHHTAIYLKGSRGCVNLPGWVRKGQMYMISILCTLVIVPLLRLWELDLPMRMVELYLFPAKIGSTFTIGIFMISFVSIIT